MKDTPKVSGLSGKKFHYIPLILFLLFCNLFFFRRMGNLGLVIFTSGFWIFILSILRSDKLWMESRRKVIYFSGLLVIYIFLLVVRGCQVVELLLSAGIVGCIGFFLVLAKDRISFFRSLFETAVSPFNFAISYLEGWLSGMGNLFSGDYGNFGQVTGLSKEKSSMVKSVIFGVAFGFPVIVVLMLLLSSADPIYGKYTQVWVTFLEKIFKGDIWKNLGNRVILTAVLGGMFLPFLRFFNYPKDTSKLIHKVVKVNLAREFGIVMMMVFAVLASFIIIQWPYVFVNVPFETDLSKFGVATYSEYVKRGFGEFIIFTVVIYFLIWLGLYVKRTGAGKSKQMLKYIQLSVMGEFFIILISIFRRIYLYQLYHGWSMGRIYGGLFLVWVAFMSLILLLRHIRNGNWVKIEAVCTAFFLSFVGAFNAEKFIVTNHPPTVNKRIDYVYLSRMSSDGIAGWWQAYDYASKILNDSRFQSTELIGKEDRRNIAYAGMVIHNLTVRYHDLIYLFADQTTRKNYLRKVLVAEESRRKADFSKDIEAASSDPVNFFAQLYIPYWISVVYDNNMKMAVSYYSFSSDNYYQGRQSFSGRPMNFLDKVYSFNAADYRAYYELVPNLPLENLLAGQDRFLQLFRKIAAQSSNERDYETDISFSTPLL